MNGLSATDLLSLLGHFMLLSLLAVGGAITTASDMHRYVVVEHGWISDAQFTSSIAIAQAAPGPNVLFVAVIGWNVAGAAGALVTLAGTMLPSTLLVLAVSRWAAQRREHPGVRAFTTGMAPLTLGLLLATGWVLAEPFVRVPGQRVGALALIAVTIVAMMRFRLSPMWLVALGAVVGAAGGI
ncbi:chromate transporter [Piscinibacter sp.]|jgi:chromate transporter|uniref:chromate transporter n=1 Tax=Piscinibacter sp. TaxID=1903157 RepID=UPI001D1C0E73|nr:chromate transporter [Piscinibacter sp.]MBK7530246.1 chromate transporter [Piscinibacter sp.]HOY34540.1 chromate transporter [Piscinibacter sp.]HPG77996.1 chromate transporter [Piscinibacter sp.]